MQVFMLFLSHPFNIMISILLMTNSAAFMWSNTYSLAKELPLKAK